ncbi:MAG: hypothetical protein Q4D06_08120 [Coriobacteriia bacterium]|nr:hypothetical protein [Coriobacteriia bacterium]
MSLYLTSASLYKYYQSAAGCGPGSSDLLTAIPHDHRPDISSTDSAFLERMYDIQPPYHTAAAGQSSRVGNKVYRSHVISSRIPNSLFFPASKSVYVGIPELCMLQLAQRLPLEELLMAYYEFCGGYRLNFDGSFGYAERKPLTSRDRATRFARDAKGAPGAAAMTRALNYMAAGQAASPPESGIACFFSSPCRIGGAGFSGAELNYPIQTNQGIRYGDVCWPKHKLVIEYDSNDSHTGADKINDDAIRRNQIMAVGWNVLTITSKQFFSLKRMTELIPTVANLLGKAHRPRVQAYSIKQAKLYRAATSQMTHQEIDELMRQPRLRTARRLEKRAPSLEVD